MITCNCFKFYFYFNELNFRRVVCFPEKDGHCEDALGMESGAITDWQITASSQLNANHAAILGRLHSQHSWKAGAWSANTNDVNQWLLVDLIGQYKVTRVATQGRNSSTYQQWVTKYKLQYSNNTASFQYYKEHGKKEHKVKLIVFESYLLFCSIFDQQMFWHHKAVFRFSDCYDYCSKHGQIFGPVTKFLVPSGTTYAI